jgi:hypothetical protein
MMRKPTTVKALEGTLRRDRTNPRAPKLPTVRTLSPRDDLSLAMRRELDRLVQLVGSMHILTAVDVAALEVIAAATCEYWQAARIVGRRGPTYKCVTQAGATMYRGRPEVGIAADAWRRVMHGYEQYGLTAASRPKVESDIPIGSVDRLQAFQKARPARQFRGDD